VHPQSVNTSFAFPLTPIKKGSKSKGLRRAARSMMSFGSSHRSSGYGTYRARFLWGGGVVNFLQYYNACRLLPPCFDALLPPCFDGLLPPCFDGQLPPCLGGLLFPCVGCLLPPCLGGLLFPCVGCLLPPWVGGRGMPSGWSMSREVR
jgi:hypothetical protein